MLTKEAEEELERQAYRIIGSHSAVKTCGWTRNMINDRGGCYKLKFYGIMSHQCLQMTTSISCANRCIFCWRGYKAPISKNWDWDVDDPQIILDESIKAHQQLLVGFKGSKKANKKIYESSNTIKHVALSLTGEPIIYPRLNELIDLFHQRRISTFLVTNAQYAEQIKDLKPVTQLYLSIDAPTKELLKEIDKPLFTDYWERMNQSLEYLAEKKGRTCIRLTMIKDVNMVQPEKYAELVDKGSPDFIEVKAYMHLGESMKRLKKENMPLHEEIVIFSKELVKHLPDYEIVSEHIPSRVVMFTKKKFKKEDGWYTWIDFEKFQKLYNQGVEINTEDFLKKTPEVGLSGKGTLDIMGERSRERYLKEHPEALIFVDEETEELSFYED
ncbi:MAG: 4-demethylwyosine synthase TYW1 [Nanoarchaeota archaeon]|nr:4-demethylwyosine synthase TYW1 [Nanoarchaeota archaeon]MBU1644374.1 4-demethylwyosine synthase TYW1 [Nanoarchaeota archaeon]MBU1977054.1 4-demethylwyosine synthase TYW1 [Nanoarchaeota archaeon]